MKELILDMAESMSKARDMILQENPEVSGPVDMVLHLLEDTATLQAYNKPDNNLLFICKNKVPNERQKK